MPPLNRRPGVNTSQENLDDLQAQAAKNLGEQEPGATNFDSERPLHDDIDGLLDAIKLWGQTEGHTIPKTFSLRFSGLVLDSDDANHHPAMRELSRRISALLKDEDPTLEIETRTIPGDRVEITLA